MIEDRIHRIINKWAEKDGKDLNSLESEIINTIYNPTTSSNLFNKIVIKYRIINRTKKISIMSNLSGAGLIWFISMLIIPIFIKPIHHSNWIFDSIREGGFWGNIIAYSLMIISFIIWAYLWYFILLTFYVIKSNFKKETSIKND